MGCDIHCCIEYRRDKTWFCLCRNFDLERNYKIFGVMAGVRSDEACDIPPRGIPFDHSSATTESFCTWNETLKQFIEDPDFHHASWLKNDEFQFIWEKFIATKNGSSQNWVILSDLLKAIALQYGNDNSRIIFWFDS